MSVHEPASIDREKFARWKAEQDPRAGQLAEQIETLMFKVDQQVKDPDANEKLRHILWYVQDNDPGQAQGMLKQFKDTSRFEDTVGADLLMEIENLVNE